MPVSLRYKGEKKFYTNYGACTSLLIIVLMLAYIYTQIMLMLSQTQYESTQTVKTVVERDLATGLEAYDNVVANGVYVDMTFGIRAFHENLTDFNDPSYFTINFSQLENEYNAFNDQWIQTESQLKSTDCLNHPLFVLDEDSGLTPIGQTQEQLQMNQVGRYQCPDNLSMQDLVSNQKLGTLLKFTSVKIIKCNKETSTIPCKTDQEISEALKGSTVWFFLIGNDWRPGNKYPVNQFYDNRF